MRDMLITEQWRIHTGTCPDWTEREMAVGSSVSIFAGAVGGLTRVATIHAEGRYDEATCFQVKPEHGNHFGSPV